jgi:hypothetical protein
MFPYSQTAKPGQEIDITVKVFNHSPTLKSFQVQPQVPDGFTIYPIRETVSIEPRQEGLISFKLSIPPKVSDPVSVVTCDVQFDQSDLRRWCECMILILK